MVGRRVGVSRAAMSEKSVGLFSAKPPLSAAWLEATRGTPFLPVGQAFQPDEFACEANNDNFNPNRLRINMNRQAKSLTYNILVSSALAWARRLPRVAWVGFRLPYPSRGFFYWRNAPKCFRSMLFCLEMTLSYK